MERGDCPGQVLVVHRMTPPASAETGERGESEDRRAYEYTLEGDVEAESAEEPAEQECRERAALEEEHVEPAWELRGAIERQYSTTPLR